MFSGVLIVLTRSFLKRRHHSVHFLNGQHVFKQDNAEREMKRKPQQLEEFVQLPVHPITRQPAEQRGVVFATTSVDTLVFLKV